MSSIEHTLVAASILLFLSVLASKASAKLGIPALLLFLAIGMLAGSDGLGGIYFDDALLAQSVGVIALALILFSGGLDTRWASVRPVVWKGLALSTIGVLITALSVGLFTSVILDFSVLEGLLLGAIVSSTDAAAVFSVLRSRNVGLKGGLRPLLELESGSNDPMAVFLTMGLTRILHDPGTGVASLIPMFVLQMVVGGVVGYAIGRAIIPLMNRLSLEYEGLYPVLTLALVLLTYGATASIGGNGFLAVYVAGVVMGNREFVHKRSIVRFSDGLALLMQITMFLALGLLVFPSRLVPIAGVGLLVSLFLMVVARPIGVFSSLAFARMGFNERAMISWVGLRGAVPIVLATFPLLAGLPQAETVFNVVFFIVLTSILLQGTSIPLIARWLRVNAPAPPAPKYPLEFEPAKGMKSELGRITVPAKSAVVGKQIVEIGFPEGALIVLIDRGDDFIVPRGASVIEAGDTLLVLADKEELDGTRFVVESAESPTRPATEQNSRVG
ncbi:MAG TPA: potassium/proton antiporter [Blastocatellia bacterium]|nr:potassium/proton antiporter [Blastocatellia bacterium]